MIVCAISFGIAVPSADLMFIVIFCCITGSRPGTSRKTLLRSGDTVTDFSHDVKACALGQASSSIMARNVIGAKADELRSLRETVRRMLKENGAPPSGKWADIAVLEPVRDYKARHASTLLTFDAVTAALDQIEAKRRAALAAE